MASKWGKKFWEDLGERVGATAVGAALGALTTVEATPVDWTDTKVVWSIIGVPTVISLLKGLLKNLTSSSAEPTASLVGVSSDKVVPR